jgi:uncharacterized protein (TIGR02118 family)
MAKNPQVKIITLLKRKAGLSREEFMRYYESRHAILATQVVPGLVDYRRMYIDPDRPAFGMPADALSFDVITTLVFADVAAYEKAFQTLARPEIAQRIADDEEHLFDRTCIKAYIVDEYTSDLP